MFSHQNSVFLWISIEVFSSLDGFEAIFAIKTDRSVVRFADLEPDAYDLSRAASFQKFVQQGLRESTTAIFIRDHNVKYLSIVSKLNSTPYATSDNKTHDLVLIRDQTKHYCIGVFKLVQVILRGPRAQIGGLAKPDQLADVRGVDRADPDVVTQKLLLMNNGSTRTGSGRYRQATPIE